MKKLLFGIFLCFCIYGMNAMSEGIPVLQPRHDESKHLSLASNVAFKVQKPVKKVQVAQAGLRDPFSRAESGFDKSIKQ